MGDKEKARFDAARGRSAGASGRDGRGVAPAFEGANVAWTNEFPRRDGPWPRHGEATRPLPPLLAAMLGLALDRGKRSRKVQDEAAIQRVISTYSQHASLAEWDAVLALFLPDAVWDIPHLGMKLEGAEAIRGALTTFFAEMDYVLQQNSPAVIDVDGDAATARSGIREAGKSAGKDEGFEFFGLYEDRLTRTADGWKFAYRTFRGLGTHYFPLLPGAG